MSSIRSASSRTRVSTPRQIDVALADEIDEAAGRGDENVDPGLAQGLDLRVLVDAAEDVAMRKLTFWP
jgi:hypothetical protein